MVLLAHRFPRVGENWLKSVTKCDILYPIKTLWDELVQNHGRHTAGIRFRTYLGYYISDHRPLRVEFGTH